MTVRRAWTLAGLLCAVALLVAVPALTFAAEEGGHGGGGGLISLDKSLLVQVVNFAILLFVLYRLLYRPFLAKMEERTEAIKKSLEEAQAARAEAAQQQEQNAARLAAAHREAASIREQALREASAEARKQMESAQVQARKLVEDARAQMDAEVRRARETLRAEVADLATSVAEKLVRKSLREEDHRRIVADAITRIGS
jgi:F-type H+-transporting ATPase subunit b